MVVKATTTTNNHNINEEEHVPEALCDLQRLKCLLSGLSRKKLWTEHSKGNEQAVATSNNVSGFTTW